MSCTLKNFQRTSPVHLKNLSHLSRAVGALTAMIGLIVLAAWRFGWDSDQSVANNFPPMTPNTAAASILIGLTLVFSVFSRASRKRKIAVTIIAILLFSMGAAALAEHISPSRELWLNHFLANLFVPEPFLAGYGREIFPVASTSVCLLLFGLSFALFYVRPAQSQMCLIPAFAVVFFSLLRQTFHLSIPAINAKELFLLNMAPHTALAIFLSILGILTANPRTCFVSRLLSQSPAGEVFRIFSISALVVPVFLMIASMIVEEIPFGGSDYVYSALVLTIIIAFLLATFFAVHALEVSEGRFYQLMEQSGDGIFLTDLKATITDVNSAGCEILGYQTTEDLIGKNAVDIFAPGSEFRLDSMRFELLKSGTTHRGEWQMIHRSGRMVPVEVSSRILTGGIWQTTVRDISARKKNEGQLRFLSHSSEVLAEALDYQSQVQKIADLIVPGVADYCIVFTREGEDLQVSATAHSDSSKLELLLRVAKKFPSQISSRIGSPPSGTENIRLFETVTDATYQAIAVDEEHLSLMQEVGTRSYLSAPLVVRNRIIGAVSMGITGNKRKFSKDDESFYRQVIYRFAVALDNARLYRDAKVAIRAREEILAIVSHDLKNPIAVADLATQLATIKMDAGMPATAIREYHLKISHAIDRMKRLVDMLLNFGKLQAGTFQARMGEIRFDTLFNDVAQIFDPLAAKKGVMLQFKFDSGVHFHADCDALSQAISNLLSNALKVCPGGSHINVTGSIGGDGCVYISVEDEGPGIPEEHRAHLFERYWQPKNSQKEGAGLGLYIVQGVARAHGGDVVVESKLNSGSKFTICFPARAKLATGLPVAS